MSSAHRSVTIFHSPHFDDHHPPSNLPHPETPERTKVCLNALRTHSELSHLKFLEPSPVAPGFLRRETVLDMIKSVHPQSHLDNLQTLSRNSQNLGEDTYTNPSTYEVSVLAVSTWMESVDEALTSGAAFALSRPPGHHALPIPDLSVGTGFCLLNNAGIAARYALSKDQVSNVSIFDFDVHHGNGIEKAVCDVPDVRFVSIHQADIFPQTGCDSRGGVHNNILNVSLPPESGYDVLKPRLENEIIPFLFEKNPEVVIISAGFDALEKDQLGGLKFQPEDFRNIAETLATKGSGSAFVFGLEGGYYVGKGGLPDAICECIAGYSIKI